MRGDFSMAIACDEEVYDGKVVFLLLSNERG